MWEGERTRLRAVYIEERQLSAAGPVVLKPREQNLHELDARVASAARHDLVELHFVVVRVTESRDGEEGERDAPQGGRAERPRIGT